jgi:hypothetical protein
MIIERSKHWQFLEDELKAETEDFNKIFCAKAEYLLQEKEEMFVAQFVTFRSEGDMIVRFPISRTLPRKGEHLFCMVLPKELRNYRNWGNKTYKDLFVERYKGTECVSVWSTISDDKKYALVGFRQIDLEFANFIKDISNILLVFAPQRPPIEYIYHLQKIVNDNDSTGVATILDSDYKANKWEPILINQDAVSSFVLTQLNLSKTMIIQGPPGTGKTYLIADICSMLCERGFSILVTALTNRALMEIAEKPSVESLLNDGKVYKTCMTTDEKKEVPHLQHLKEVSPIPGSLVLSTFYISSGFAANLISDVPFDYVIMDEASQALTAMFAATKKMGKHNLWVGDIKQLGPIVKLNEDRISSSDYNCMINGFQLLSDNCSYPNYQLTTSWRFAQRTADYTGIFYNGTLVSKNPNYIGVISTLINALNKKGGPALILTDMPLGDESPLFAIKLAIYIVGNILKECNNKELAVLSCFIKTTKALQKLAIQHLGSFTNILIETIARVQGLTADITVFVIPNTSLKRSLEPHLFNVATSRAREHTIIIADKSIINVSDMDLLVHSYIQKLSNEQCVYIPSNYTKTEQVEQALLLGS